MGNEILVAEDDTARAERFRSALESYGFPVIVAVDGAEALDLAGRIHPKAIVSDVLMPNMDGFELCWEVRRAEGLSATPVILTTSGWRDEDSSQFARDVGATALVDLPMAPEVLVS